MKMVFVSKHIKMYGRSVGPGHTTVRGPMRILITALCLALMSGCALITTMDDVAMDKWFGISEGQVLTTKINSYLAKCDEIKYHCLYDKIDSNNRDVILSIPSGTEVEFIQAKLRGNMFWIYPYAVVRISRADEKRTIMVGRVPYRNIFENQRNP